MIYIYFGAYIIMVSKEVEEVYKALNKHAIGTKELVLKLVKGINTNNIELIESISSYLYLHGDEYTKLEISKRLYKKGYFELIPLNYIKMFKNDPRTLR